VGDAHPLAGRVQIQPYPPGEPLGTGAEARVPAAAGVELADQGEQARGGGVQMRGELGDLVAEALQGRDARMRGNEHREIGRHG
jgi:hypothetical protein